MAAQLVWEYWMVWREDESRPTLITKVYARLYYGDVTTENERDPSSGGLVPVTRFRLLERLSGANVPKRFQSIVEVQDSEGFDAVVLHLVPWVDANGVRREPQINFECHTTEELSQRIIDWAS